MTRESIGTEIDPARFAPPASRRELHPATDYSVTDLAELFTRVFEGYFVPVRMTADGLSQRVRSDSIDLRASRVLTFDGIPSGFVLVGSRGWTRRVSAMGVLASSRGHGVGRALIESVIEDARRTGFRRMLLEVVERNTSARVLYEHIGFERTQRLVGYERPASVTLETSEDVLKPIDPRELARVVRYEAPADLPWQLSAETVAAASPPSLALRLEDKAYALVSNVSDRAATIETLVVPHALRRQGWGARLLHALAALFPMRTWRIPARFPDNLAVGFFEHCGFKQLELSQIEMTLELS